MKKFIAVIVMVIACLGFNVMAREDVSYKLIVDDKIITTEAISINDRTMVPLRTLLESTGANVAWDDVTQSITVTREEVSLWLQIGTSYMNKGAENLKLDASPILYQDTTTYVPLRAICEAFSFEVDWDENTKTILIHVPGQSAYVDVYDGMTVDQFIALNGMTPMDFIYEMGLDYEQYKDSLFIDARNAVKLSQIASLDGISTEELIEYYGFSEQTTGDATWGEALGEMTLRSYLDCVLKVGAYDISVEEAFDIYKQNYGLGDEYSLDTRYKYVRTIFDLKDLEVEKLEQEAEKKAEEQFKADKEALSTLTKKKIFFQIVLNDGSLMQGELYPNVAPKTVENFVNLCRNDFYDGLIFHRVIDGFMIQGGAFDKDFNMKETSPIIGEFYANGITNALSHERGVISMARTDDYNSASSQFFIMDENTPYLDGQYAAFGRITQGLDVLDRISQVKTITHPSGHTDVPQTPVIIKNIVIIE